MRLYINIDHVATIREARRTDEPDPIAAAALCEAAGADGITVHLREDRRHIQDNDVRRLRQSVRTALNLELSQSEEIVAIAEEVRPDQATLVPERREEITTEGGLDCRRHADRIAAVLHRLKTKGIRTSLFITPDAESVVAALELRPDAVELHTGRWAHEWRGGGAAALAELREACERAHQAGVAVHAGHGLTRDNVGPVAALPHCEELNIGHSIVSRAVFVGLAEAVREMRERIDRARVTA
ncbi:MAG TPA: pyridoxine 5'-phosphate synthase [Gemmatimonadales bacterium]|nr:pyridoxine 5'-phosphate synthase [Gemmatimonadales bacterium]